LSFVLALLSAFRTDLLHILLFIIEMEKISDNMSDL
jgi:hypothetical protein